MMAQVPSSAVALLKVWMKILAECSLLTGCSFVAAFWIESQKGGSQGGALKLKSKIDLPAHLFSASPYKAALMCAGWDMIALALADASNVTCEHGF